jgi:hypothetical protein
LIDIRTKKIEIINEGMNAEPLVRIQYSSKVAGISNSWKKWIGEIQGLNKMNTIGKKQDYESDFSAWVSGESSRMTKYGNILPRYKELYDKLKEFSLVNSYTAEVINGAEAFTIARSLRGLADRRCRASARSPIPCCGPRSSAVTPRAHAS